ncbi:MAG: hypothetical protein CMB96_03285 [Flavobacteriaceae bacterium]|nr:hypothetical protein [Flavobacteriaceae bacterium]
MKNITTALLCLLFSVYSFSQCDYTLKMMDSFGDGWNGNSIDVLVDGVVVLDDATLADGSEALVTFQVNTGAEVTTIWNGGGSFASEISYEILDNDGNLAATGNSAANVVSGQCIAVCPVISCSYTLNLLDSWGDGWNGNSIDVLVDGVEALDNVTLADGSQGTETFAVSEGADVTTVWNGGGSFAGEVSYEILDTDGIVVGSGNSTTDIISGTITAVCPSCPAPGGLQASLSSGTEAVISWTDTGAAAGYEIVVQIAGTGVPTTAGTPTSSNPLTITGLSSGTSYEVYLRADCGTAVLSSWSSPVNFTTSPACGDIIYDSGGSTGDYSNNELITTTIFPENPGDIVTFTFNSFNIENNWDFLTVYDGPDNTFTEIGVFTGTTIPDPITSTDPSGALTFVFDSDGSVTYPGYEILTSCGPPPTCLAPTDLIAALSGSDSAVVSWTAGESETVWEYVLQPQGTGAPTTAGTPTTDNPLTLSGLSSGTAYEVFIRADCGAGDFSAWTGPANFATGPACGDTIYDSGGAAGDYSNNELITTTVFPDNPGDVVTFTFLSFATESCCDGITVYNGPDTSFDPVDDEFRGTEIPDPITSTDPSGALTFVFDSDGSVTSAGYEILISCGPPPTCLVPTNLTATLNALGTSVSLSWNANNGETQWEYVLQPQGTGIPTTAGTPITTNPLTISDLDWSTDYEVYLRADCGEGDFSTWTSPAVFSTPVQTNYTIDCDAGEILDLNYCYTSNDTTAWLFTSSTAFPIRIIFNSGNIEAGFDDITIYDGPDNTGTVLFNNNDADIHDLTGLEFQSTSTSMYMEVDSDGSVSCESSTTFSPWDFSVSCATCVTQTVDFSINGVCSPYYEFYVDANISDMGDATSIELADNFGATQTVTTTGIVNFGPYAANDEIIITAVNANDASCFVESDLLTFICPPPPNECSIVYAGEDSSLCSDDDATTTLTASYHILGQDTSAYEITSVNNCEFPSFLGGTPTSVETDDEWSDVIDIGFEFCFFGGTYNQLLIGSNGVVSFDLSNANGYNGWSYDPGDTLPNSSNSSLSDGNIFGVAHDIDPSVGGEINFMILGSAPQRQFVVNYTAVPLFSGACNELTSTSQIILYESSNVIDVNIIDKPICPTWNDGLAVVGIQNMDDTIAYTPTNRNMGAWEASNESWRFSPSLGNPNYLFEWYDGTALVGTEQTITVSPETTTTYTAAITYELCTGGTATVTDSVIIEVAQNPVPVAIEEQIALCDGEEQAVLEVYVDDAQQIPEDIVYSWSYNDVVYVSEVSEVDGGNILTLGDGEFDLLTGDYIVTAYNTVTECASDTVISINRGTSPELEDGTSFSKCADGEVDLYVNITNDPNMDNTYVYDWSINGVLVSEGDTAGTFTHGEAYGYDSVTVNVTDIDSNCSSQTTITINPFMNENCVDIPQGISPNGDGLNDCLVLDHLEAQEDIIKAEVYNRYGTKVFELNDYIDQWCGQDASDGNINSNGLLPVGTYFYVIQYASDREPTISWIYLNY